jgi:hypothetical protein
MKDVIFNLVLVFFENVNKQVQSGFPLFRMKEETSEHLHMLFSVLKYVIFPASLCYAFIGVLLGQNTLDSVVWGVLIFVYCNFLPDLPAAFRNKKGDARTELRSFAACPHLYLVAVLRHWSSLENLRNFSQLQIINHF